MTLAAPATPAEWACLAGVLAWLLATAVLVWHMARAPRVTRVSQAEETAARNEDAERRREEDKWSLQD